MNPEIAIIALQNKAYHQSLIKDIQKTNKLVECAMDVTLLHRQSTQKQKRVDSMNSMNREQRRRLINGESLGSILGTVSKKSKYYNTSTPAANAIKPIHRFEYQIGKHLMIFETKELELDDNEKLINIPVVVWDDKTDEWHELNYSIVDEGLWDIVDSELHPANPAKQQSNKIDITKVQQVQQVQDALSKHLSNLDQPTNGYNGYDECIYTPEMESNIKSLLDSGCFPFEIVEIVASQIIQKISQK